MRVHANAPLGTKGRETMVLRVLERGWSRTRAAEAAGVSERTCSKWIKRYLAEGEAGLLDRSSAPKSIPHRTPEELVEVIVRLRRLRMTGAEIAFCLAMALSTVSAVLLRVGLGKLSRLAPPEPPNRYERRHAGELLHVDVKKLARIPQSGGGPRRRGHPRRQSGAGHRVHGNRRLQRNATKTNAAGQRERQVGWEYVHVCVDDATRLAYVEVLADEKAITAVGFLKRAIAFYARHGITVQRVMTDNGSAYRSTVHAFACRALRIRHLRTRPYRPRTNGKAERFIRTLIAGWAYGAIYGSSRERTTALDGWLWTYNHRRPHGALSHKPPIARLNDPNNPAGSYS
jgi:transposase InsO family protein/transposase